MKLLGSTKSNITKDENNENVPCLEITEVVLLHRNIVNNDYQQVSRVLCTFVSIIIIKTFDLEFLYTEVWFIDQNSKPHEIEKKHHFSY